MKANVGDTIHFHSWKQAQRIKGVIFTKAGLIYGVDTSEGTEYIQGEDIKFVYSDEGDAEAGTYTLHNYLDDMLSYEEED